MAAGSALYPAGPGHAAADPGPYAFPVRPETAEWARLETHDDMLRVTQLPKDLATSMSTESLVTTVLDYPLLIDVLAFNTPQFGFDVCAARFGGFAELLRRPDAGPVLLERYAGLDVKPADGLAAHAHAFDLWKVELLLAQRQVLRTLSARQLDSTLRTAYENLTAKKAIPSTYDLFGLEQSAVLIGRGLARRANTGWGDSVLLRDAKVRTAAEIDRAMRDAERFLADPEKPTGPREIAQPLTDHLSTIYTPKGTPVTVWALDEFDAPSTDLLNRQTRAAYPLATFVRNASRTYNCHAFAWYSTSPFGNYWMNDPGDNSYWLDGSYIQWFSGGPPYPANLRWSWQGDDHSGIGDDTVGAVVVSKWGNLPQMRHPWAYCPYKGSLIYKYLRNV
ncbi:hypothetical protein [Nonomuraea jiangxiensis]|uniref:Uncharacterized protein n=1 Tax=Nonomuraea jiangxiensis TaxID=633440 RepID=A0A1G9A332_9ACTN|nr:hypothetical protein [Nonomuraea jiangxiensis]SDK21746.1 hypothetical protein SAMN05421869_114261 [Nonomuraea jiangxiensis]